LDTEVSDFAKDGASHRLTAWFGKLSGDVGGVVKVARAQSGAILRLS
jgi:hypothetical protein